MTKLNHNRPYLRFIDNLRRELKHAEAGSLPNGYGVTPKSAVVDETGLEREVKLSKVETGLALDLLNALDVYVETMSDLIGSLSPSAKRQQKKTARTAHGEAEKELLAAATRALAQMFLSKSRGDGAFLSWHSQLEARFTGDGGQAVWDILNNFAMKHAVAVLEKTLDE